MAATNVTDEVGKQLPSEFGVSDLGVKLQAVDGQIAVSHGGVRAGCCRCDGREIAGESFDLITMTHPGRERIWKSVEQPGICGVNAGAGGAAEFTGMRGQDPSTKGVAGDLHAIADTEDRDSQLKDGGVNFGRTWAVDAGGASGKNQAAGSELPDSLGSQIMSNDLAKNILIADSTSDQLGGLRPEVHHQYQLVGGAGGCGIGVVWFCGA